MMQKVIEYIFIVLSSGLLGFIAGRFSTAYKKQNANHTLSKNLRKLGIVEKTTITSPSQIQQQREFVNTLTNADISSTQ